MKQEKLNAVVARNFVSGAVIVGAVYFGFRAATENWEPIKYVPIIFYLITGQLLSELVSRELKLRLMHDDIQATSNKITSTTSIIEKIDEDLKTRFEEVISQIRWNTASITNAKFVDTKDQILQEVIRLQSQLTSHIKAVLYSGANSPPELTDETAKMIDEKLKKGITITFTAVLVVSYSNPPEGIVQKIEEKNEVYKKNPDVWKRINLRLLNQHPTVGIDTVILDDKHVIFLIADPLRTYDIYRALIIENCPGLAVALSVWFEREVLHISEDFEIAKGKIGSKSKSSK